MRFFGIIGIIGFLLVGNSQGVKAHTTEVDSSASGATKLWSLEECVAYAMTNNLSVSDQVIQVKRSENAFNQDKLDRYPVLNSSASHNYNFGRTIDPFTNQYVNQSIQSNNFSLTSSVTLYNGGRITNTIERSKNEVMRSKLQYESVQNQIALQVADAFLQILFAKNQLTNFQEINKSTQTQLEQAKALYDAGSTNQRQYLNLKAQDARDQMNIQSAKGNIRLAKLRLLQVMQLEDENFDIASPSLNELSQSADYTINGLLTNVETSIPDIQLAKTQLTSSMLSEKIAKSGLYPRLSLFGNVNSLYSESRLVRFNPTLQQQIIGYVDGTNQPVMTQFTSYETRVQSFGQQLSDNFGQAAGLSLSIPIFNGNQVKANIKENELNTQLAMNNLERTKMSLKSDVIQAYTDYENSLVSYQAALENEKAQEENYAFLTKSTEAGVTTTAELVLALNDLSIAKNDVEKARFQLLYSRTILHFYNTGDISIEK